MTDPIRVIVADDHAAVRAGLVALLRAEADIDVVAEAGDGPRALAAAREHRADVVLTDVRMPGATGIDITPGLRATGARVLVVSAFDLDEYVLGALAAGADGYLVKSEDPARFLEAVRAVAAGDAALSQEAMQAVLAQLRRREGAAAAADASGRGSGPAAAPAAAEQPATAAPGDPAQRASAEPVPPLTGREEDVLRLLARGMSNREISRELFVELTTVKSHITHVLAKLGVDSRLQAALWWQTHRGGDG
ncbi:LuxR family transcriptional regulator [Brachybacterium phenoliresistens]|uniref:LuxR family transcriptional regulator n=1 Tax=Brachybacterium phenoliresistens TaxID=396014 RepID=Z9JU51_9MICO|nr:response regulator transcription factor [Brachybacterium phenoliresistens]EWS81302.1 LuxR family transcriptional regulator [Brachybacterium phenoliresistens]